MVGRERARERSAVARLQDGSLDLDEPPFVERPSDRRDNACAGHEDLPRLLVHQQVEIALSVAQLDVGDAVERIRERLCVAGEDLDALGEHRRLPTPRLRGPADDADDVSEVHVDLAGHCDVADHLDATGAVDEVEEDELAHSPTGHRAARQPARLADLAAALERLGLGADSGDLVPVGKARRCRLVAHRRIVLRCLGVGLQSGHRSPSRRFAWRLGAAHAVPGGADSAQHRPGRHVPRRRRLPRRTAPPAGSGSGRGVRRP